MRTHAVCVLGSCGGIVGAQNTVVAVDDVALWLAVEQRAAGAHHGAPVAAARVEVAEGARLHHGARLGQQRGRPRRVTRAILRTHGGHSHLVVPLCLLVGVCDHEPSLEVAQRATSARRGEEQRAEAPVGRAAAATPRAAAAVATCRVNRATTGAVSPTPSPRAALAPPAGAAGSTGAEARAWAPERTKWAPRSRTGCYMYPSYEPAAHGMPRSSHERVRTVARPSLVRVIYKLFPFRSCVRRGWRMPLVRVARQCQGRECRSTAGGPSRRLRLSPCKRRIARTYARKAAVTVSPRAEAARRPRTMKGGRRAVAAQVVVRTPD
eukprot:scaffold8166_cov376-Prasinococcus_capsulatus_cf.AAC.1